MALHRPSTSLGSLATTNNPINQHEFTMKYIIGSLLSLGTLSLLPSCTVVESREPTTHTTRTTSAEVTPATYGTVETRTTRTY